VVHVSILGESIRIRFDMSIIDIETINRKNRNIRNIREIEASLLWLSRYCLLCCYLFYFVTFCVVFMLYIVIIKGNTLIVICSGVLSSCIHNVWVTVRLNMDNSLSPNISFTWQFFTFVLIPPVTDVYNAFFHVLFVIGVVFSITSLNGHGCHCQWYINCRRLLKDTESYWKVPNQNSAWEGLLVSYFVIFLQIILEFVQ